MSNQAQMKALAREALKLVKDRAPSIVNERIVPQMLDEIADYTGELMGKLTNLPPDNDIAITMAHGIIRGGLLQETMDQASKVMLSEADKRIKKLFKN